MAPPRPDVPDPAPPPPDDALDLEGDSPVLEDGPGIEAGDGSARDVDRLATEPPTACLNCGSVLPGQFCPDCGQKDQPIQQPAHVFIAESVSEYFGLDGRLWRSIGALLFRPGVLTLAYLEGRRTHYLRPLRLYLSATVLFFFLLSFLDPFALQSSTVILEPTPRDEPIRAGDLEDRLDLREDAVEASQTVVQSAIAVLSDASTSDLRVRDSLEAEVDRLERLDSLLVAAENRLEAAFDDDTETYWGSGASDSLVVPSRLDPPLAPEVLTALEDTGRVQIDRVGTSISTGLSDAMPDWMKGDLARQMEETESPVERNLLAAQFQRAVLRQVPTALFIVLPLFALLLKLFYLGGGGRWRRGAVGQRPRWSGRSAPLDAATHAARWTAWRYRQARTGWRRFRARRRYRTSVRRKVLGAPRRFARWVRSHEQLRWLRIRRIRELRKGLESNRPRFYSEHLVFALHVHAFTFVVLIPTVVFGWGDTSRGNLVDWVGTALLISIPVYFLVAQRRVYLERWLLTVSKSLVLFVLYATVITFGAIAASALALRLG